MASIIYYQYELTFFFKKCNVKIKPVPVSENLNIGEAKSSLSRNSCPVFQKQSPEVFCKKDVLRKFPKFKENTCVRDSFLIFNKVADLRSATLLKKRLSHKCFAVNFAKFLRTPFLKKYLWWLLLVFGVRAQSCYH